MQALSKAEVGGNYTIQWLFGLPEVVEFLHRHHVEEGGSVQVIQKLSNGLIIGANGERFAMGNEIMLRSFHSKSIFLKLLWILFTVSFVTDKIITSKGVNYFKG